MIDAELLACTAAAWTGDPKCCRWCDKPLTGRQQRWCSTECADEFGRNHWWTWASRAAYLRDEVCQRCGRGPNLPLDGPALLTGWPASTRTGRALHFQTHHIVWLVTLGVKHDRSGCHHHLDGLELLCDDCHYDVHHPVVPVAPDPQLSLDSLA